MRLPLTDLAPQSFSEVACLSPCPPLSSSDPDSRASCEIFLASQILIILSEKN